MLHLGLGELGLFLSFKTDLAKLTILFVKISSDDHDYFPRAEWSARLGRLEGEVEEHGQTIRIMKDKITCLHRVGEGHAEARFSTGEVF